MLCLPGEDAKLKQMLWVVENLQEELFRAQEYRLQAEKRQHQHRATITTLQVSSTVFNNTNCSQENMANYARHKRGHFWPCGRAGG